MIYFPSQGSRCILAGDHLQLPPTIQSVEAESKGLGRTLFERLADLYGDDVMSMLTVQYRMHELIMNWSSEELYQGKVLGYVDISLSLSLSEFLKDNHPNNLDFWTKQCTTWFAMLLHLV